jgi:hypothetical protein
MIEVYVDDFMSLVIPISKLQLLHTAAAVMTGIHGVFPANDEDDGDGMGTTHSPRRSSKNLRASTQR